MSYISYGVAFVSFGLCLMLMGWSATSLAGEVDAVSASRGAMQVVDALFLLVFQYAANIGIAIFSDGKDESSESDD